MKNTKIIVRTKDKPYPIYFGNKILDRVNKVINYSLFSEMITNFYKHILS